VHQEGITNLDVDGLFGNPSLLGEDLVRTKRHGGCNPGCDWEEIFGWHATTYVTLMLGSTSEVLF